MTNTIVSGNEKELRRLFVNIIDISGWEEKVELFYENQEAMYFITSGYGVLEFKVNSTVKKFQIYSGKCLWVPMGIKHNFINYGDSGLRIICYTCKTV